MTQNEIIHNNITSLICVTTYPVQYTQFHSLFHQSHHYNGDDGSRHNGTVGRYISRCHNGICLCSVHLKNEMLSEIQ